MLPELGFVQVKLCRLHEPDDVHVIAVTVELRPDRRTDPPWRDAKFETVFGAAYAA